jgi:hypothetical protein
MKDYNMIIGGLILLLGIQLPFTQNTFDKNTTSNIKEDIPL